jgi:membrane-bound lytic murein transglycosylase B
LIETMFRRHFLFAAAASTCSLAASANTPQDGSRSGYLARADVQAWIDALVAEHGLARAKIEGWMRAARYDAGSERLMTPTTTPAPRDWQAYRRRALDERRVLAGLDFWKAQREPLLRAQQQFGVAPEVIVAILGIETMYGRYMGRFVTLDVLATLSFDYLRRAEFFRAELGHFLVLAEDGRIDPLTQTGSFAGAIGLPQFMPGSIRRYALDYDNSGQIDLAGSESDAIGSIANYLHTQGWQADLPVHLRAQADEELASALGRGILAQYPWSEVAERGVRVAEGDLPPATPVLLVDLPTPGSGGAGRIEYRVGTQNFASILHYNRSYFYASAVSDLSDVLAARLHAAV